MCFVWCKETVILLQCNGSCKGLCNVQVGGIPVQNENYNADSAFHRPESQLESSHQ